jgi:OPA family glycerol-3-phosphate transporter-like MFS transporter
MAPHPDDSRLRNWQFLTAASLFAGYAGYYICRSNLAVAAPLLTDHETGFGVTKEQLGDVTAVGLAGYALGKFTTGPLADRVGGRTIFLAALFLSVAVTVGLAFAPRYAGPSLGLSHVILVPLVVGWGLNRYVQAMGWGGLVLIVGRWFPPGRTATVMGILSMSYLLGDAAAKWYLGQVLAGGAKWESLFLSAAGTLGAIGVAVWFVLKASPGHIGLLEYPPPESSVDESATSAWHRYRPLLVNRSFLLVCLLSGGLTLIRETFNFWTPTYFREVVGLDPGRAAEWSSVFPLVGAFAALFAGWLADRRGGRTTVVTIPALFGLVLALLAVPLLPAGGNPRLAAAALSAVAVLLIMPYSFLAGAVAIRFGGRGGAATAANLIDTAGYLAGVLSGSLIGRVAERAGWNAAFHVLAVVAGLSLAVAVIDAVWRRPNPLSREVVTPK